MIINYSDEKVLYKRPSIFLAGPSPRNLPIPSWRKEAVKILEELGFDGVVYVPVKKGVVQVDYLDQANWEKEALTAADVICFWVPRKIDTLPGFTTNVEFGEWVPSGKCVYGRPNDSEKIRYLDWFYRDRIGREPLQTLEDTLKAAISLLKELKKA